MYNFPFDYVYHSYSHKISKKYNVFLFSIGFNYLNFINRSLYLVSLILMQIIIYIKMSTKINLRSNPQTQLKQIKHKQNFSPQMKRNSVQQIQNPQNSMNISRNFSISASKKYQSLIPLEELKGILSQYPELKELPLNPVSQTKQNLWRDSPCTVRCISRNVSLDRTQKFKIGSIYYRDNINEQKKVFTESEKPELMLKNFRRQIGEASHSKRKYSRTSSQASNQKPKNGDKFRKTMHFFHNKFYQIPQKTQLKFDRNGCRSVYSGEYDVKVIMDRLNSTRLNFTSSRRIDLALPLNFNPGPGKYFSQENQEQAYQTCRTRKHRTLLSLHKKNSRINSIHLNRQHS